jgi:hypothetical protein
MGEKVHLKVVEEGGADRPGLGRREILQGLFAGVGAGLVFPGGADAHAIEPALAAAVAKARTPGTAKLAFLDEHQFATLSALCARIVPGSDKALADRFIDELLAVVPAEKSRRFLTALGAIEGASLARFQKPFRALSPAEQDQVLEAASSEKPGHELAEGSGRTGREDWVWTPGTLLQPPEPRPEELTLRNHFDHLKKWIAESYYSSEAGLKELGYTGQTFFASFPDCQHPEHS